MYEVRDEWFRCAEAIFQPAFVGVEGPNLGDAVATAIAAAVDASGEAADGKLYAWVVLVGLGVGFYRRQQGNKQYAPSSLPRRALPALNCWPPTWCWLEVRRT